MCLFKLSLGKNLGRVKKAKELGHATEPRFGPSEKKGGCTLAEDMAPFSLPLRAKSFRSWVAFAVCLALLYFAAGGNFLHQHRAGQDSVCHICQSLHAPALATAGLAMAGPEIAGWHDARPIQPWALYEISLDYPGRAPPTA
jgi:hypothetical protein